MSTSLVPIERNAAFLLQPMQEFVPDAFIVFVSTADGAVDISAIPAQLEESDNATGDIIVVAEELHGGPDKRTVEQKGNECVLGSFGVEMACAR